jgi:hypothetical protein
MKMTIKSKILGKKIEFSRPGNFYIYVDLNGQPGTLGNQICENGGLMGSTIGYNGDDEERFITICRRWYRNYIRKMR